MTLLVALKSSDGLVMAADSRGTIGDPRGLTAINDNQTKLFRLGKCGLAIAGASEMGAALIDELRRQGLAEPGDVDTAIATLVPASANLFSLWFREIPAHQRAGVVLMIGGYRAVRNEVTEPLMYLLNSQTNFAPQLFSDTCLAGVPQYAIYLVHRYYDKNISIPKATALAEYLITETASQDPKVGGKIDIATITSRGFRRLTENQVLAVHKRNEALNRKLRGFFATGGRA